MLSSASQRRQRRSCSRGTRGSMVRMQHWLVCPPFYLVYRDHSHYVTMYLHRIRLMFAFIQ